MYTENYLIIGGATKSGTTSLFKYLEGHPDICAVELKETRFFLETTYPLDSKYRLERDGSDKYAWYFSACTGQKLRLEATPDYLYSATAARDIHRHLANVKIIFILRDPVTRFRSWYNFAIATGRLDKAISLDDFFTYQLAHPVTDSTPQFYRALEQGCYSSYLQTYFDTLGRDNVLVATYDELVNDPLQLMRRICTFADIDPGRYDQYQFEVHNKTFKVKYQTLERLYMRTRFHVANYTNHIPILRNSLRLANRMINPLLAVINRSEQRGEQLSQGDTQQSLQAYYRDDILRLEQLLGRTTGWLRQTP